MSQAPVSRPHRLRQFLGESVTLLLRVLPHLTQVGALADPELHVLASIQKPFAKEVLTAVGLGDRLLPYDPCRVYPARSMYVAVGGRKGQTMPTGRDAASLRRLLAQLPLPAPAPDRAGLQRYVVLIDRSDAKARLRADGTKVAIPRQLSNAAEVELTVASAFRPHGVWLLSLRTASLPLAQQARTISQAVGLVGVHGAGLTNALLLPEGAGLLELIPADHRIPNAINADDAEDIDLSSQCGFTMFWYLAAVRNVRHYAVLMHLFEWEAPIVAPLKEVSRVAKAMAADITATAPLEGPSLQHEEL